MNDHLENVFLHDDVHGGKLIGFYSPGMWPVGQDVGYIVTHEALGAVYVAYACHPTAFLQPSHLKTIAERLQTLNEQA